ncbi:AlpA family transcriptional regulator [Magnetospirillum sp. SS-4]|uniref:helix-turn-helix transcriptional regulator n=1 Tax=Magnetospirillum sp. SS-4 TaxID=2681465 RepID=UPI001383A3CC|nr:AlpA family phage regulatory protein [Magnetospirillum sp. SS-4]CAA7621745.1 hypothetical protein MTBSS4_300027 [Magnetospirillum sp. SS-4]
MIQFDKRLVSKTELKSVCGIPYTPRHIGRLEAAGKFPKRVNLGPGWGAWVLSEVDGRQRLGSWCILGEWNGRHRPAS